MRFVHKKIELPEIGDYRMKTRFLFLPKRIMDETRWLETAVWEEKYLELTSEEDVVWVPVNWENE